MGVQKNATYKVDNGIDFDEINFKTIAEQVKMDDGKNLKEWFSNSIKDDNGLIPLGNGFYIQYGYSGIPDGIKQKRIIFPVQFNNACKFIIPIGITDGSLNSTIPLTIQSNSTDKYGATINCLPAPSGTEYLFLYLAIGY